MASLPCRAIESGWTLGSLVGTYLDLALAYLCLCAAAVAFLAAKLVALFGVPLPCSCGGQVSGGHHHGCHRPGFVCLQALLLDYPTAKIAGVHMCLRRRFLLDTLCHDCRHLLSAGCCCCSSGGSGSYDVKLVNDDVNIRGDEGGRGNGVQECTRPLVEVGDGAESRGSVSKPPRVSGSMLSPSDIVTRGQALELETSSGLVTWEGRPVPVAISLAGHEISGDHDELVGRATSAIKCDSRSKNSLCEEKIVFGSEINVLSIIGDLKQALEEEKSAHAALLLELEKERNWAATAADEAMAMILRLQEEKSAIEMEARQCKRMSEEKSAYDEEELDILKEIIVRRERETHVLEKEIESYREMMLSDNGISESNAKHEVHQITEENNLFSSDETELMLKEIYKSIKKKEKTEEWMECLDDCKPSATTENNLTSSSVIRLLSLDKNEDVSYLNNDSARLSPSFEKKHQTPPNPREECDVEEKDMLTFEDCASFLQRQRSAKEFQWCRDVPRGENLHKPFAYLPNEQKCTQVGEIKMRFPLEDSCTKLDQNEAKMNSKASQRDNEVSVVDVHVIDDITDLSEQGKENDICLSPVGCASNTSHDYNTRQQPFLPTMVDHSTMGKLSMHRSRSDSTMGLSDSRSYPRSSWSDLRSSISSVDSERFKLENEVEILRKRLKIIQKGREKLGNSLEQREKEMHHLQVLEEIACQLQEIRKATDTEKSIRRASLPPSSSMVTLKKRRCRSVSTEQQYIT